MAATHNITLQAEGMTCDECARHVTEALESLAGVEEVQVTNWRLGQAVVAANALSKAIKKAGYRAVVEQRAHIEDEVEGPIGCCCC